ncbi:hypothetical protein AAMO2058_000284300 [Amorphochlora amoebiformis]
MDTEDIGGVWIDGEFYEQTNSQPTGQSKEEAMLGVFGNFEYNRRSTRTQNASLAKPMRFVGGDLYKSADVAESYNENAKMEEEEKNNDAPAEPKTALEIRREARLAREKAKKEREAAEGKRERRRPKPRAVKADKDFAGFQKLSGGLGMKMLQKMGYKGGALGRYGNGIVNPVKTKLRPQQMGLGYGGYKERANMTQAEIDGGDDDHDVDNRSQKVQKRPAAGTNWKRSSKKPKRVYKTINEIKEEEKAKAAPELVIDMRGPHVRVTSLDKVGGLDAPATSAGDGWTPTGSANTLPELKWNMDALVEHTESEVRKTLAAVDNTKKRAKALHNQRDEMAKRVDVGKRRAENLAMVVGVVVKAREQAGKTEGGRLAEANVLLDAFEFITEKYRQECTIYGVDRVAMALLGDRLQKAVAGWRPLLPGGNGTTLELVPVLRRCRRLFVSEGLYKQLVETTVLSPISLALSSCEMRKFAGPISLIETIKMALLPEIHTYILTNVVVPRLRNELNMWNPTRDQVPVHTWIHPWLDLLPQAALEAIFAIIRSKLQAALFVWRPMDSSALVLVEPWKDVWKRRHMWEFLSRSILPKLRTLCQNTVVVNPSAENPKPFVAVVKWHTVVPHHALVSILFHHFFPKWLGALARWLRAPGGPNKFEQVARWYKGWRELIPPTLLTHPIVETQVRKGLDLMNAAVNDQPLEPILTSLGKAFPAQQAALRREANAAGEGVKSSAPGAAEAAARAARARRVAASAAAGGLSLREALERFAARNSIEFVPNPKKGLREGCPVYTFGRRSVYIKGKSVFAHVPKAGGGGEWMPVALDELLSMAK